MAKESGIPWNLASRTDGAGKLWDIRNDVGNVDITTPRAPGDVTGLDKYAMEKLLLLADYTSNWSGFFNDADNMSHDVLKTVSSKDAQRWEVLGVSGQLIHNVVLITDYSLTRGADGSLNWTAPSVLADGKVPTWATGSSPSFPTIVIDRQDVTVSLGALQTWPANAV